MNMTIDELLETPYWIIDILPKQVPMDSPGQYFAVEEYYLSKKQIAEVKNRHISFDQFQNSLFSDGVHHVRHAFGQVTLLHRPLVRRHDKKERNPLSFEKVIESAEIIRKFRRIRHVINNGSKHPVRH